jgi:hypothetical protein
MQIFYHGSPTLFTKFDLSHVLEGDGKVKFGFGVYLTSSFASAAHYSGVSETATSHYVYTVEIHEFREDNHIEFKKQVNQEIVKRAETKLGSSIPTKYTLDGKDFRKYLAKTLGGGLDVRSEKMVSEFLMSIGVEFITWPYSWKNPDLGVNVAVLDDSQIKILSVHEVELDDKKKLIPNSEKEVKL